MQQTGTFVTFVQRKQSEFRSADLSNFAYFYTCVNRGGGTGLPEWIMSEGSASALPLAQTVLHPNVVKDKKMMGKVQLVALIAYVSLTQGCAKSQYATSDPVASAPPPATVDLVTSQRNRQLAELTRATTNATPEAPVREQRIGSDDLLQVTVFEAPDMGGSVRVSAQGDISLPLIGVTRAAGLTPEQLARALEQRLRATYMRDPHVSVQVSEAQSQPVSVLGAVKQPGVVRIRSTRSLLEILALAGGLAEDAGETVLVSRANATPDAGSELPSSIEVDLGKLLEASNPTDNVPIHPGDIVKVQRAGMIYVVGDVNKPGAFPLTAGTQLTAVQALALGQGLRPTASRGRAIIVRTTADGVRSTIPVNTSRVLSGGDADMRLQPNDVVFVPSSAGRTFTLGAIDALVRTVARAAF